MTDEVKIFVDKREANSRIAAILSKRCLVEEKQLPVADYLLSKRVAVERKTSSDFLSSMIDGRLFRQIEELKSNFRSPLLIIEGNGLFNDERKIHPNAIRGALASISIDYGVPILVTENNMETAEMLFAIAKREQLERNKSVAVRGRKAKRSANEMQEYLVSGLPKINRAKARALLKHFGTPERVFTATQEELVQVGGIGPLLAKKIRRLVQKKYEKSILED
jgi:Fanconi anemia group M protein